MCVTFDSRQLVTRKAHRCAWDGEVVPKGATVHHYKGIFEGDFQDYYMHPECWAAFTDLMADYGESCMSFEPYANRRGSAEDA